MFQGSEPLRTFGILRRMSHRASWDVIVVGAGTAGLMTAIFSAQRGARILVIEAADRIGGTLHYASGQMSAAGTQIQSAKGIVDSPQDHYEDVMRISEGTADPDLVRLAVFNAADTLDWLIENGFEMLPEHPVKGHAHEPYNAERYYWGPDGGLSVLAVLQPLFEHEVRNEQIDLHLNTKPSALRQDARGTVIGVEATNHHGDTQTYEANHVVLTSGGYASNSDLLEQLEGQPKYVDMSSPYSLGEGLQIALKAGGFVRGGELHLPNFGYLLEGSDFPSPMLARLNTYPEHRQPWEIYVNANGDRFIREDEPSVHQREKALSDQPLERYWIVFDQGILDTAPPIVDGWSGEDMHAAFGTHTLFFSGDTIAELATNAGIHAGGLENTVQAYNKGVAEEQDRLGREHMPLPLATPPFHAILAQGSVITSAAGLAVDAQLRVIRQDGRPIPNLYAAGEILGHAQFHGRSRCGGMSVTPALTCGRLLGERLLRFN